MRPTTAMPQHSTEDYHVGWVCALPKELTASRAMLDEEYETLPTGFPSDHRRLSIDDSNNYVFGKIGGHNVVMACLPAGIYGTNAAGTVANNMWRTFSALRIAVMVGIAGGIPSAEADIRLGDIVVSQPDKTYPGVVQYDLYKNLGEGKHERKGCLRPPPTEFLTALSTLQSTHDLRSSQVPELLTKALQQNPNLIATGYARPDIAEDRLYCSRAPCLPTDLQCSQCEDGMVLRAARTHQHPVSHYGIVASGNELVKDVVKRDQLGKDFGAKCVEMEAAGLTSEFPCIVVRGICDYADSHKNDKWQKYAALAAAAFAKELLLVIRPMQVATIAAPTKMNSKYNLGLNLFQAPVIHAGLFVGREDELKQIHDVLQPMIKPSIRRVVALGGMGGIGKTQTSIKYAEQYSSFYSTIFWLNANSETELQNSFQNMAKRLLPSTMLETLHHDQLQTEALKWLSEPDNFQWLLIFDNYDDPDAYSISNYYPFATHGFVIITTRLPDRINAERIKLNKMQKATDGLHVLSTRSGRHGVKSDAGALLLVQKLDGHPLALATAASFLRNNALSFAGYLKETETTSRIVSRQRRALPDYKDRTLYTTWTVSLNQIEKENNVAAELLKLLAYFDTSNISYELLKAGADETSPIWFRDLTCSAFDFACAMSVLSEYCLVETHMDSKAYSVHVCVHDWLLNGIGSKVDEKQQRYALAFRCVASCAAGLDLWDFSCPGYRSFIAHAQWLTQDRFEHYISDNEYFADEAALTESVSMLLLSLNLRHNILFLAREILTRREKRLDVKHLRIYDAAEELGQAYSGLGLHMEAEALYQRALEGYTDLLGVTHHKTLKVLKEIGLIYCSEGRTADGERILKELIVEMQRQDLGPDITARVYVHLARLYSDQGRLTEAEELLQEALSKWTNKDTFPTSHAVANSYTLNSVYWERSMVYQRQGRLEEAEAIAQHCANASESLLGPTDLQTLQNLLKLAFTSMKRKHFDGAEAVLQQVISVCNESGWGSPTEVPVAHLGLAVVYIEQKRWDMAEKSILDRIELRKRFAGRYSIDSNPEADDWKLLEFIRQRRLTAQVLEGSGKVENERERGSERGREHDGKQVNEIQDEQVEGNEGNEDKHQRRERSEV